MKITYHSKPTHYPLDSIHAGDCVDLMASIPDNYIDLTVTSPPYDNLRDYKGYTFDFESIAKQLWRVTKHGGVVVWIVADATIKGSETGTSFRQALYFMGLGFRLHDTMIYNKTSFSFPGNNRYHAIFEYMFVLSKGKPKAFNPIRDRKNKYAGDTIHGTNRMKDGSTKAKPNTDKVIGYYGIRHNVWTIPTPGIAGTKHPAIFPEVLAHDHIISWSNEGDTVLDPMCGSGTTLKQAKLLNRHYIGFDISPEYCDIARQRVDEDNLSRT